MPQFFISYSSKDLTIVRKIIAALADDDLEPWVDWKSIPKGEKFEEEIYQGIEESEIFLFLISPDSVASEWCIKEIDCALINGKRILPIVIHDTNTKSIRSEILERNWIFCREGRDDFNQAIEETRKTICTDYEWLDYHTKLQVKALEWARKKDASWLLQGNELREAEEKILRAGVQKDPQPTQLHHQYVLASQKNEIRRRRQLMIGLGIVLTTITILVIFALIQRKATTAEVGLRSIAEANEANAKATALADAATAQANIDEQEKIVLARKLSADAKDIFSLEVEDQILSGLLAVESMNLYPNIEALRTLQSITLARPISNIDIDDTVGRISTLTFSTDEETQYLIGGTSQGIVYMWETASGRDVFSASAASEIVATDFNGQYLSVGDYEGNVYVWEPNKKELSFQIAQEANIAALEFIQYGKYLLSIEGGGSVTIKVWDVKTGREISRISHNAGLRSFAISSDGKLIALSTNECEFYDHDTGWCRESNVQLWEIESEKLLASLKHARHVNSMAFSSYYGTLITGSSDGINGFISLWNDPWVEPSQIFLPNVYSPVNVAISPNGLKIATSNRDDHTTRIWSSGKEISHSPVDGILMFSGDSRYLTIYGVNDFVVLESGTGREVARISADRGRPVIATNLESFHRHKNLIATSVCDAETGCYIQLWDFFDANEVSRATNLYSENSIDVTSDGTIAVTGGYYSGIKVWNVFSGKSITETGGQYGVTTVSFSLDGTYFVAGGKDGTARVWGTLTGDEVTRVSHADSVTLVTFSPDGTYVLSGSDDHTIKIWDPFAEKIVVNRDDYYGNNSPIVISSDSRYVASVNKDNTVSVWEALTGKNVTNIPMPYVSSMVFSTDGKFIVLSSSESRIQIRDVNTGGLLSEISCGCDAISSVDISPDNKFIVTGSYDQTVRIWDVLARSEIMPRKYHNDEVTIVSFSVDGNYVMSGSRDNTVRIWGAFDSNEIARMRHDAPVTVATFSPDGKYVLSAGVAAGRGTTDGVRVWFWQPVDILADVCSRLPRSLSLDEWERYVGATLPYPEYVCIKK